MKLNKIRKIINHKGLKHTLFTNPLSVSITLLGGIIIPTQGQSVSITDGSSRTDTGPSTFDNVSIDNNSSYSHIDSLTTTNSIIVGNNSEITVTGATSAGNFLYLFNDATGSFSSDVSALTGIALETNSIVNINGNVNNTGFIDIHDGSNFTITGTTNADFISIGDNGAAAEATFSSNVSTSTLLISQQSSAQITGDLENAGVTELSNASSLTATGNGANTELTLNDSTASFGGNLTNSSFTLLEQASNLSVTGNVTTTNFTVDTNSTSSIGGALDTTTGEVVLNENMTTVDNSSILNITGDLTSNTITVDNSSNLTVSGITNASELDINNSGSTRLNGDANISTISVNNGILTLNGNTVSSGFNLANGSSLHGTGSLTTANGLTINSGNSINPGDNPTNSATNSSIGTLTLNGNYVQVGTYNAGIQSLTSSDTLAVNGSVFLLDTTSILNVNDSLGSMNEIGSRTNIINATGSITGGFSAINETGTTSRLLFDIATGDLISFGVDPLNDPNCTDNQRAILTAVTTADVFTGDNIDSSTIPGELFNSVALQADTKATLNAVSPEGYIGALDYTLQSLDSYSNAVRTSAPISTICPSSLTHAYNGASSYYRAPDGCNLEILGGWNSFTAGSDISTSGNDYDLEGSGGYLGARFCGYERALKVGGFIAYDNGESTSANVNLDATGIILGAFIDVAPKELDFIFHGDISYGSYEFDGTHGFNSTTATSSFDSSAFRIGAAVDYILTNRENFKLLPTVGLHYLTTTADSFTESGTTTALNISEMEASSLLFDIGAKFELVSDGGYVGLTGYLGYQYDAADTEREVSASFTANGNPFTVGHDGGDPSAFVYNIGGYWNATDVLRFNVNYFGESRSGAQTATGLNIGANLSF